MSVENETSKNHFPLPFEKENSVSVFCGERFTDSFYIRNSRKTHHFNV